LQSPMAGILVFGAIVRRGPRAVVYSQYVSATVAALAVTRSYSRYTLLGAAVS
jgi:hypothetical protein